MCYNLLAAGYLKSESYKLNGTKTGFLAIYEVGFLTSALKMRKQKFWPNLSNSQFCGWFCLS